MSGLIKTVFSVCALCVLYTGCFTVKPEAEVTLAHGRIILDTTQHYAPQVGDKMIMHIRHTTSHLNIYERIFADSIAGFLMRFPNVVLEVGTHTDFRGSHEYNDTLSSRRAWSLTALIIAKGIDPRRLIPIGYGENVPRILAEDMYVPDFKATLPKGAHLTEEYIHQLNTKNEQEAAHYLNRRTELVIVEVMQAE